MSIFNKINKITFVFILMFGFTSHSFLFSQQPSYLQFTLNNGLPSNNVYYVIQDKAGYFWFATDKGLARFNGYNFNIYTTNDGLNDNEIFDIYEDSQNRIWFSCSNGNLSYYKDGQFFNNTNSELLIKINAPYIGLKVLEDNNQSIQFITQKSKITILKNAILKQNFLPNDLAYSTLVRNSNNEVISLSYNRDNIFLNNLTTSKQIVFSHDNKTVMPRLNTKADMIGDNIYFSSENKIVKKGINSSNYQIIGTFNDMIQFIRKKSDSQLWIGTQNGLFVFDLKLNRVEKELFNGSSISSVLVDNENHLWITTLNNGVFLLLNQDIELINKNNGLSFDNSIYLKVIDSTKLFIGSSEFKGAFLSNTGIENIELTKSRGNGIIRSVRSDRQNNYYILTPVSIVKLDKNLKLINEYKTAVRDIYFDNNDSAYIARSNGVSIIHINDLDKNAKNLDLFFHTNIRFKHSANYFYKSTLGKMYCIGNEGIKILGSSKDLINDNRFKNNISDLVETKNNFLFVSSRINGIKVVYNNLQYEINTKNGMPSNFVTCLSLDSDNVLWAGTTNGLAKIAYHIINNKLKLDINNYNTTDGLINNSINDIVFFKNKLWVSTDNGICTFEKKYLIKTSKAPQLSITSLAFNDSIMPNDNTFYSSSYNRNNLKINFCGISSGSLNKIKYSYRMKGLEENWNITTNLQLQYPSLVPGNYEFEIQAINSMGISSPIKQIAIQITPAFYQTILFKISLIVFTLIITTLIIAYRIKVWRRNHELRESLLVSENKRLELAKEEINMQMKLIELEQKALRLHMNPHFVFNALNAINGFYASGEADLGKKYITKLSQLLRMLLDFSSQKFIAIQQEVDLLNNYFILNQLRFQNKYEYKIIIDPELNVDVVAIPPMIIQPFVENALIHGIAPLKELGHIEVKIMKHNSNLRCEIRDNGIGRERSGKINEGRIHTSTGIKVTEERIKAHYTSANNQPNLTIEDLFDNANNCIGTLVRFELNLIEHY